MENRKRNIIICLTFIILIVLILVGLTYAYYLATVRNNPTSDSFSGRAASLELYYRDGSSSISTTIEFFPGDLVASKEFSLTNYSNTTLEYQVYIRDVVNTFSRKGDLVWSVSCTKTTGEDCYSTSESTYPSSDTEIFSSSISPYQVHYYKFHINYKSVDENQSVDMGARYSGRLNIGTSRIR